MAVSPSGNLTPISGGSCLEQCRCDCGRAQDGSPWCSGLGARRPPSSPVAQVHPTKDSRLGLSYRPFTWAPCSSPWGFLGSHSFGILETSQECLHDLPQEERRIFNIQDTPVLCQVLCQALLYISSFNHCNNVVTRYYNVCVIGEETEL